MKMRKILIKYWVQISSGVSLLILVQFEYILLNFIVTQMIICFYICFYISCTMSDVISILVFYNGQALLTKRYKNVRT